jgi:uncharacterized membrane protein
MTAEGDSPTRPWLLALAYLPILGLLPLALEKHDLEVRWHARNGLLLFLACAAVAVLATLIGIAVPALSCLYAAAMAVLAFLYVAIAVLAIVKAFAGERLMIPWISRRASRLTGPA